MTWITTLQMNLGVEADGVLGPETYRALFRFLGAEPDRAHYFGIGAAEYLPRYQIDANPDRLIEFLGECAHESAGFRRLEENLNYSSAERIRAVWPSRFRMLSDAEPFVRNPEALANRVYANRLGNGDEESGDGWRYRGRGLIQITGCDNYRLSGDKTGLPLVAKPHLAADPETSVLVAAEWWRRHGLNLRADQGESRQISAIINTGRPNGRPHGLPDRNRRKAQIVGLIR